MEISCWRHGEVLAKCLQFPRDARETQLRLLQDSLSVTHISPEEEADLMLALHYCTQGEKEVLLEAARRPAASASAPKPRRSMQDCTYFPCVLPLQFWKQLEISKQGEEEQEIPQVPRTWSGSQPARQRQEAPEGSDIFLRGGQAVFEDHPQGRPHVGAQHVARQQMWLLPWTGMCVYIKEKHRWAEAAVTFALYFFRSWFF